MPKNIYFKEPSTLKEQLVSWNSPLVKKHPLKDMGGHQNVEDVEKSVLLMYELLSKVELSR